MQDSRSKSQSVSRGKNDISEWKRSMKKKSNQHQYAINICFCKFLNNLKHSQTDMLCIYTYTAYTHYLENYSCHQ